MKVKRKILAENFKKMVWKEFEQKLQGIITEQGRDESVVSRRLFESDDIQKAIEDIPAAAFTEHSLGTPNPSDKEGLVRFVRGLEGDSISAKMASLSSYLANPPIPKTVGDISNFISYVNAIKTLTSIISDFKPSSAGFLYESFLAACLDGVQVSGEKIVIEEETLSNIADIKINEEYYGIKFNKSGVVSGSFRNLMATLSKHKKITYLVSIKKIKNTGLETDGAITTYKIPITQENITSLLTQANNPSNNSSMCFPEESFLRGVEDTGGSDLTAVINAIENILNDPDISPTDADLMIWGDKSTKLEAEDFFDINKIKLTYGWQRKGKFKFNKAEMKASTNEGDEPIELKIGKEAIAKNIESYLKQMKGDFEKILGSTTNMLEKLSSLVDKTNEYTINGFERETGKAAETLSGEMYAAIQALVLLVDEEEPQLP